MTDANEELALLLARADSVTEPQRGDLLRGLVLSVDSEGLIVDLGLKRDGVVPRVDLDKLPPGASFPVIGDEVAVMVVDPIDRDGNLVVSIAQAMESEDWLKAHQMLENETIIEMEPSGYNRGGLIVPFGRIRGFIPVSHLSELPRGLEEESRTDHLKKMVGRNMPLKVIEVDPRRRRLVLSERKAVRTWRQNRKAQLIEQLKVGECRQGVVTSLREFGAFVDIGGADGLIHISELSWKRIEDPAQVLSIGQDVEVQVIRLDHQANRIGLSLKRMQPSPWHQAVGHIDEGQVVKGEVTYMASTGVYIQLESGPEGRLRTPDGPGSLTPGMKVLVEVIAFDPDRERLDLQLIEEDLGVPQPAVVEQSVDE
jgi:small subunit ribosomal protein S1